MLRRPLFMQRLEGGGSATAPATFCTKARFFPITKERHPIHRRMIGVMGSHMRQIGVIAGLPHHHARYIARAVPKAFYIYLLHSAATICGGKTSEAVGSFSR